MKKKGSNYCTMLLCLTVAMYILSVQVKAQLSDKGWVVQGKSSAFSYGNSVIADSVGDVYSAGYFHNSIEIGNTVLTADTSASYLVKHGADGSTVQWAHAVEGEIQSIALCKGGDIVVTGRFFLPIHLGGYTLESAGFYDIFVARIDSTGKVLWAQRAGGEDSDHGIAVAVDKDDNIYITGEVVGSADFGDTRIEANSFDMFIAKYSPSGELLWVRHGGGSSRDVGTDILVHDNGNIYVTGGFTSPAQFGDTTLLSGTSMFLVCYSPLGELLFVRGTESISGMGTGIATDRRGNIYVVGTFIQSITIGNQRHRGNLGTTTFLVCYDTLGTVRWVRLIGSTEHLWGNDISISNEGDIWITGRFSGTFTAANKEFTSNGNNDIFVLCLDSFAVEKYAYSAGGEGGDVGTSIAVTGLSSAYVTGYFSGRVTFPFPGTTLEAASFEMMLWHIDSRDGVSVAEQSRGEQGVRFSPTLTEGALDIYHPLLVGEAVCEVYTLTGTKVAEFRLVGGERSSINIQHLLGGVYGVRVVSGGQMLGSTVVQLRR